VDKELAFLKAVFNWSIARGLAVSNLMVTTWVDFRQLKADVAIEQVVAHYGIHLRRVGRTELRGRCPLPAAHLVPQPGQLLGQQRAQRVVVPLAVLHAGARRPIGGNILDFVALMERGSIREAALRLQQWSGAAPERFIVPPDARPDPVASENPRLRFALQYIDAAHPYPTSRGVTRTPNV
jgi:hypothetical protein